MGLVTCVSMGTNSDDIQSLLNKLQERADEQAARAEKAERELRQLQQRQADLEFVNKALQRDVAHLMSKLAKARSELAKLKNERDQVPLGLQIRAIEKELERVMAGPYGTSSERRPRTKKGDKPSKKAGKKKPRKGHGPTPQPKLPLEERRVSLDEPDRVCPHCPGGVEMRTWEGHEQRSEEIHFRPVEIVLRVVLREVARCPRCGHLETAPAPRRVVPGGRYSNEFIQNVAIEKYAHHQPLSRQAEQLSELGLQVTSQTLWDQVESLGLLLEPHWLAIHDKLLSAEVLHVDETTWRVGDKSVPGRSKRWWAWTLCDGQRAWIDILPSRGREAAAAVLSGYDGILMADRYSVYESLERARSRGLGAQLAIFQPLEANQEPPIQPPDYQLAACWMHARRGFFKAWKVGDERSSEMLDLIGELYRIESEANRRAEQHPRSTRRQALLQARKELREQKAKPVLRKIRKWLDADRSPPGTMRHAAVQWVNNGWDQLIRFQDDERIPLDNGVAERVIRPLTLGRKTHYGSRSAHGARTAAIFYSLFASCRLAGVEPRAWMAEAVERALVDPTDIFLPEDLAARRNQATSEATSPGTPPAGAPA